ncbi:MAG: HD-GYP domain-containing protein, partial [Candidatus Humimicrobiaceae bacterium]
SIGKNIIKYHHEKYDGSGYPFKIKCIEIPIEARIFALADAYDAIRSKRPYKEPFDHNVATERIKSDTAKHFDPDIVSAFLKCQDEFLRASDS